MSETQETGGDGPPDKVLDHNYDGIREYDNPLPAWWLYLFYATIAFAPGYVWFMHYGPGNLPAEAYKLEMAEAAVLYPAPAKGSYDPKAVGDPARIAAGAGVFSRLCLACHGPDGGGLVGPNLTDDYWIHGGSFGEMTHTIAEGVPAKGMISWKSQLSAEEISSVAAFIKSLRGTSPANPKAPEGQKAPD